MLLAGYLGTSQIQVLRRSYNALTLITLLHADMFLGWEKIRTPDVWMSAARQQSDLFIKATPCWDIQHLPWRHLIYVCIVSYGTILWEGQEAKSVHVDSDTLIEKNEVGTEHKATYTSNVIKHCCSSFPPIFTPPLKNSNPCKEKTGKSHAKIFIYYYVYIYIHHLSSCRFTLILKYLNWPWSFSYSS